MARVAQMNSKSEVRLIMNKEEAEKLIAEPKKKEDKDNIAEHK